MTSVRERRASSTSDAPNMPRAVPSSVTVVRSLGMVASFHGRVARPVMRRCVVADGVSR